MSEKIDRRDFLKKASLITGGAILSPIVTSAAAVADAAAPAAKTTAAKKMRLAIAGTGGRGTGMWGGAVQKAYPDVVEYVGFFDPNPGRAALAVKTVGAPNAKVYTDFDLMMKEQKPDTLIVTTVDAYHHEYIIKGMEYGADIITEKPMTIDEFKCQAILDAEKKYGKKVTVTFNYRYSPHRAKIWELLNAGEIGEITSVDFHWYLDTRHGADYFRRWHRLRKNGGSLWVHKATHHFDLLNWWLNSEPEEVYALGALEFYGKNGKFRSEGGTCRTCSHTKECKFYWDIKGHARNMELYVANEKYDGYFRDGCVFKEDIDIFDKMGAVIKYANGVQATYSLTAYSPYEGYRIAFNGTKGRLDAWIQESNPTFDADYDEIVITRNFGKRDYYRVSAGGGDHGGGDTRLKDKIFKGIAEDPLKQSAGTRDGAFSILVGIAARNSIDTGKVIKIADLTDLKPRAVKA